MDKHAYLRAVEEQAFEDEMQKIAELNPYVVDLMKKEDELDEMTKNSPVFKKINKAGWVGAGVGTGVGAGLGAAIPALVSKLRGKKIGKLNAAAMIGSGAAGLLAGGITGRALAVKNARKTDPDTMNTWDKKLDEIYDKEGLLERYMEKQNIKA